MSNEELFNKFVEIENGELNSLNKRCAIKKLEEDYKQSEYSKCFPEETVFDAYEYFIKDYNNITNLFDRFRADLPALISNLGSSLDLNNMFANMDDESKELFMMLLK